MIAPASAAIQTMLMLCTAVAVREANLARARYTPPLPSGAFAMLSGDAMMILPSGVKHGNCPCSAAPHLQSYCMWLVSFTVVTKSCMLTVMAYAYIQCSPAEKKKSWAVTKTFRLTIMAYAYVQCSPAEKRKAGRGPSQSGCAW